MNHGDESSLASSGSPTHTHPFRHLLRPLSQCLIPAVAHAAPLPVATILPDANYHKALFFAHSCISVEAHILCLTGLETHASLAPRDWISLIYVTSGDVILTQAGKSVHCASGSWLLIPAQPTIWKSSNFSVACFMLSWAQLARDYTRMNQPSGDLDASTFLPRECGCLKLPRSRLGGSLLKALIRALQSMADLLDGHQDMIGPLGIEEYVCRLVVLLVTPSLWEHSPGRASTPTDLGQDPAWDSLLAYIEAHLDQPLSLTLLQNHFHYSRRALQYTFRRQLGCTATQWIRARRLDLAHDLLCHPATTDSVASIAQACGYRSMSLFSIEFQKRFHIKPSILLRHSRKNEDRSDSSGSPTD